MCLFLSLILCLLRLCSFFRILCDSCCCFSQKGPTDPMSCQMAVQGCLQNWSLLNNSAPLLLISSLVLQAILRIRVPINLEPFLCLIYKEDYACSNIHCFIVVILTYFSCSISSAVGNNINVSTAKQLIQIKNHSGDHLLKTTKFKQKFLLLGMKIERKAGNQSCP